MTLTNAFRDGEDAAILLSDTAAFNEEGVVQEFGAKIFALPACRAAVACSAIGGNFQTIADCFADDLPTDIDGLRKLMPLACARYLDASLKEGWQRPYLRLVALAWCDTYGPRVLVCEKGLDGPVSSYESAYFFLGRKLNGAVARLARKAERHLPLDIAEDIIPALEEQRAAPFTGPNGKTVSWTAIGGEVHCYRITADGIAHGIIHSWPDRVGERIEGRIS